MIEMKEGEVLIKEIRRHWIVIIGTAVSAVLAAVLPLFILLMLRFFSVDVFKYLSFEGSPLAFFFSLYLLWLLIIITFLTVKWTEYYLDVWYITNIRVVDVDQGGLFARKTKTLKLNRVQDITVEVKGALATLVGFGDIHVQTAGASRQIVLRQSPAPHEIKSAIMEAIRAENEKRYGRPE